MRASSPIGSYSSSSTRRTPSISPEGWPPLALATTGSHDLARLHGWWEERDIDPGAEGPAGRAPEEHPVGAGVALGRAAATPQGSEHEAAWWMFCFWLCRAPYNIDRPPVTGTTAPEM
jgi:hypothetical protein